MKDSVFGWLNMGGSKKSPNPPAVDPAPVPTDAPASPLTVRESKNNVDAENGAHEMVSCLVLFAALTFFSSRYFVLFVAVCLPLFSSRVTDCG